MVMGSYSVEMKRTTSRKPFTHLLAPQDVNKCPNTSKIMVNVAIPGKINKVLRVFSGFLFAKASEQETS